MNRIKEIFQYRELLKSNVKKEIRGKYKKSFLGVLWSFINPLLTVIVYAIVFPYILKIKQENYLVFLIVGIIPWTFFTTTMAYGTVSIVNNANIIKKVYFPREILPISITTSGLINFFISCIIILVFVLLGGIGLSWNLLFLPLIALIQYILTLGLVFITSAINVYVRDAEYIINFIIQMLFYATPILYTADTFPQNIRWILDLNPFTCLIESYRNIFYYKVCPNMSHILILLVVSMIILLLGYIIFKNLEKNFAEEV